MFIARTVLVQNNDIESACRILNRILGREGILDQFRRTRYYEKPFQVIIIISLELFNDCTYIIAIIFEDISLAQNQIKQHF